jgi:sterol desaturase/sphingolipid hydroxylase (fatty acid hydroxylase superfamily)/DNA-binding beta-propeller fold protein YncE
MMDQLLLIRDYWLETLAWVVGLGVAFGILVRLTPCNPGMYWWRDRRAAATDFMYWFIVPLLLRICRMIMLVAAVVLLFGGAEPNLLPVRHLNLWLQALLILVIQDVLLYWIHRVFHTRLAWKFHAVHHSPTVLDWMSSARFHPINNLLSFALVDVAVLLLGFSPAALILLVPFNYVYSSMVHANLNWTFGPLRYLFASPVFHRWHHTTQEEGLDRNFASTFPFLDLAFGTFHMPPGKLPEQFGVGDPDFPDTFWGQFMHPLRPTSPRLRWLAVLLVLCGLGGVGVLAGGMYYLAWQASRNEQLAQQANARKLLRQHLRAEAAQAAPRCDFACGTPVLSVGVSADGCRVAAGRQDGTISVWDAGTGQPLLFLTGHTGAVRGVAVSSDGKFVVSGSYDRTMTIWDVEARQERVTTTQNAGVLSVAISPDGNRIVESSADGSMKAFDAVGGRQTSFCTRNTGSITSVAISGDGRTLVAACENGVKLWDAQTGQEKDTLQGDTKLVCSVAISQGGACIVSGSHDSQVKVWDARTGRLRRALAGHKGAVYSVAISGDGKRIVSGGEDGSVRLWDARTGSEVCVLTQHAGPVMSVAISADGQRIVSGSQDGTVKVWDVAASAPPSALVQRPGTASP